MKSDSEVDSSGVKSEKYGLTEGMTGPWQGGADLPSVLLRTSLLHGRRREYRGAKAQFGRGG